VSEVVTKRLRAVLKLLKHAFDAVPISMSDPSEIEAVTVERSVKPGAAIDEKQALSTGCFSRSSARKIEVCPAFCD